MLLFTLLLASYKKIAFKTGDDHAKLRFKFMKQPNAKF